MCASDFRSPPATAVESSGAKGRLWRKFQILASGGHVSGFRFAPPSSGRSAVGPKMEMVSALRLHNGHRATGRCCYKADMTQ
ncbi:hypothetical protein EHS39_22890 [Ensifer sp. MPMI2T]|nr:hypothetical protein EHS39_22890 [Ensifer sp. MPMI2T]